MKNLKSKVVFKDYNSNQMMLLPPPLEELIEANHPVRLVSQVIDGITDPDATFMRMKEDHMRNGQVKPGYNVQVSTSNQYIVNYSHRQNPTDTTTLPSHLRQMERLYHQLPQAVVADAGYGSEENCTMLELIGVQQYVNYSYFDRDQRAGKATLTQNMQYNQTLDCYYCPMGQQMQRIGTTTA